MLSLLVGQWALRGYGHWAMEEKASGVFIGHVGFYHPEGGRGLELGWMLSHSYRRKGYATEGANAAANFLFKNFSKKQVICIIHHENNASIKLAERLGATFEGSVEVDGVENLKYCLTNDRYRL